MSLDTTKVVGGMTSLPEGTYGNFPEKIHINELVDSNQDHFVPPPLLTKQQLLEQIGPELMARDPLWFLYDIRQYPCVKKFTAITTATGVFSSTFLYYAARKVAPINCIRVGSGLGLLAGGLSLFDCARKHYAIFEEQYNIRRETRDKVSFGIPETIQRQRDMEKFIESHPELLEAEKNNAILAAQRAQQQTLAEKQAKADEISKSLMQEYEQLVAQQKAKGKK